MTAEALIQQQILQELHGLEPDRWLEVLDFIGYLKNRSKPSVRRAAKIVPRELTARELLQSDLVGLWADREDVGDSLEFARRLRRKAEYRWETGDAAA